MRRKRGLGKLILACGICLITGCQSGDAWQSATEETTMIVDSGEVISEPLISSEAEDENVAQTLDNESESMKLVPEMPEALTITEQYYQLAKPRLNMDFTYEYCEAVDNWSCTFSYEDVQLHELYDGTKWITTVEYAGQEKEVMWSLPISFMSGDVIKCSKADITSDGFEELLVLTRDEESNDMYYVYDLKNHRDISPVYSVKGSNEDINLATKYYENRYLYKEFREIIAVAVNENLTELYGEGYTGIALPTEDFCLPLDINTYDMILTEDNCLKLRYQNFTNAPEWRCELTLEWDGERLVVGNVDMMSRFQVYRDYECRSENAFECDVWCAKTNTGKKKYFLEFIKDEIILNAELEYGSNKTNAPVVLKYKGETVSLDGWYVGSYDNYGYFELKDMDGDISNELVLYRGYNEYSVKVTENPNPVNSADRYSYEEVCEEIEEMKVFDFDTMSVLE